MRGEHKVNHSARSAVPCWGGRLTCTEDMDGGSSPAATARDYNEKKVTTGLSKRTILVEMWYLGPTGELFIRLLF